MWLPGFGMILVLTATGLVIAGFRLYVLSERIEQLKLEINDHKCKTSIMHADLQKTMKDVFMIRDIMAEPVAFDDATHKLISPNGMVPRMRTFELPVEKPEEPKDLYKWMQSEK